MRLRGLVAIIALLAPALPARADGERALADLEAVRQACATAEQRAQRELLVVEVEPGWSFGALTEEGFLPVEANRNFRMVGDRVELFASRLEPIGLVATEERAEQLEAARARGARLRVGFFLGFDEPDRTACLIRSRHATSTVRMDVAFLELLAEDGSLIAREDTNRYRAWQDDAERDAVPGEGPRAALGAPTVPSGTVPETWERGVAAASSGPIGRALSTCHRDGVARGAEASGRVIVRLRVDGRTGRVVESEVAVSNVGDTEDAECMATTLRQLTLPPGTGEMGTRVVDLQVPVRVAAD